MCLMRMFASMVSNAADISNNTIVLPGLYPLHWQYRAEHASTLFQYCAMVCMLIAILHGVHSFSAIFSITFAVNGRLYTGLLLAKMLTPRPYFFRMVVIRVSFSGTGTMPSQTMYW